MLVEQWKYGSNQFMTICKHSAIYGPRASRLGHKSKGEKRGFVTYVTDREEEVRKRYSPILRYMDTELMKNKIIYPVSVQTASAGRT